MNNISKNIFFYFVGSNKEMTTINYLERDYKRNVEDLKQRIFGFNEDRRNRGIKLNANKQQIALYLSDIDRNPLIKSEFVRLQQQIKGDKDFIGKRNLENMRNYVNNKQDYLREQTTTGIKKNEYQRLIEAIKGDKNFTGKRTKENIQQYLQKNLFRNVINQNPYETYHSNNLLKALTIEKVMYNFNKLLDVRHQFNRQEVDKLFQYEHLVFSYNITNPDTNITRADYKIINYKNKDLIMKILTGELTVDELKEFTYEEEENIDIRWIKNMKISLINKPVGGKKSKKVGGFYNKVLREDIQSYFLDETRQCQIYGQVLEQIDIEREEGYEGEGDNFNIMNDEEPCIIHTLRLSGVSETDIMRIKTSLNFKANEISIINRNLDKLAEILQKNIIVHSCPTDVKDIQYRKIYYPKCKNVKKPKYETSINISYHNEHFFVYLSTKFSKLYVKNFLGIEKGSLCSKIIKDKPERYKVNYEQKGKFYYRNDQPSKVLNTLELIVELEQQGLFTDYSNKEYNTKFSSNYICIPSLNNIDIDQDIDLKTQSLENLQELMKTCKSQSDTNEIQKEIVRRENNITILNIVGDTEAFTHDCHGNQIPHIPNMLGYKIGNKIIRTFKDSNTDKLMSRYKKNLYNDITTYLQENGLGVGGKKDYKIIYSFFNLKYDVAITEKYFYIKNEVVKDNQVYSKTVSLNQFGSNIFYNIEFRDAMKHLSNMSLNKSCGIFSIKTKAEAIGYSYYNQSNFHHTVIPCEDYKIHIKKEHQNKFYEILEKSLTSGNPFQYNKDDQTFNPITYYEYYLKQDIQCLYEVLQSYDKFSKQIVNTSYYDSITISSMAHRYVCMSGCYDNVNSSKSLLREFFQKSIVGGKVAINPEDIQKLRYVYGDDLDANSLYPSAIKRLCEEYGIPCGEIYELPYGIKYNELNENDIGMSFVRIALFDIPKKLKIGIIAYKNEKTGLMEYRNNLPDECNIMSSSFKDETSSCDIVKQWEMLNKKQQKEYFDKDTKPPIRYLELFVNKITLEDYITYHNISFEILSGVYWKKSNGVNRKLGELVKELFRERNKAKREGNTAKAEMIKLILNSIYGKTIMCKNDTRTVYKSNNKYEEFLYSHFGVISSYEQTNTNWKFELKSYDNDLSLNFVGSLILSMSKRIMNEVFSVMNENHVDVLYTDTDSIHLEKKSIELVANEYFKKYGRNLIGDELCQFKSDFNMTYKVKPFINCLGLDFSNIEQILIDNNISYNQVGNIIKFEDDESSEIVRELYYDKCIENNSRPIWLKIENEQKAKRVVSICSVFISPKIYMDILQGYKEDGTVIYDVHLRIKGITPLGIEYKVYEIINTLHKSSLSKRYENINLLITNHEEHDKDKINLLDHLREDTTTLDEIESKLKLFTKLANGEGVHFILNPDVNKPMFNFTGGGVILRTTDEYKRYIKIIKKNADGKKDTTEIKKHKDFTRYLRESKDYIRTE